MAVDQKTIDQAAERTKELADIKGWGLAMTLAAEEFGIERKLISAEFTKRRAARKEAQKAKLARAVA